MAQKLRLVRYRERSSGRPRQSTRRAAGSAASHCFPKGVCVVVKENNATDAGTILVQPIGDIARDGRIGDSGRDIAGHRYCADRLVRDVAGHGGIDNRELHRGPGSLKIGVQVDCCNASDEVGGILCDLRSPDRQAFCVAADAPKAVAEIRAERRRVGMIVHNARVLDDNGAGEIQKDRSTWSACPVTSPTGST